MPVVPPSPFARNAVLSSYLMKKSGPHSYGCLMAILPKDISEEILYWSNEYIPDRHLGEGGREDTPHITIKYGFRDSSPETVQALKDLVQSTGPISVKLGVFSLFRGNKDGDVLKVGITSFQLNELNRVITQSFDCEDKYPDYKPHVTIAYINPNFASAWTVLPASFLNRKVTIIEVEWSSPEGKKTRIPLGGSFKKSVPPSPFRSARKDLVVYSAKSDPVSPVAKESYFATCERDEQGHCLPSGQSGNDKETGRLDLSKHPSPETLKKVTKLIDETLKEIGGKRGKDDGYCMMASVRLWDKLGQPSDCVPYSFAIDGISDEEDHNHVALYNKSQGWVIDPVGEAVGQQDYIENAEKSNYLRPEVLSSPEIRSGRGRAELMAERTSKKKSLPVNSCPSCGSHLVTNGKSFWCGKSPCEWSTKSDPVPPKAKESYFASCERDEQGHCLPSGQSGSEKPEEESSQKETEEEEWDGKIDADEVDESAGDSDESLRDWHFYDEGEHYLQEVYIVSGEYTLPNGETVDVYRWESRQDRSATEKGEWTTDENEAKQGGEDYASENNMERPDPEDSDIPDELDGLSWRNRDEIASFTDSDGDEIVVKLDEAEFEFYGEQVTAYRWTTKEGEDGEWTLYRRQAIRDGKEHAEENDSPPEEEEEGFTETIYADDVEDDLSSPPPLKSKKTVKLGKSKAKLGSEIDDSDKQFLKDVFGFSGDVEVAISSILGAPDDAVIQITSMGAYKPLYSDDLACVGCKGVRVRISHPKLDNASRFIGIDSNGKKFIRNEIIEVKKEFQKEGLGLDIFSKQVENAAEEGFEYIATHAAGGPGESMNGYYTWPRFGYNQSIKSLKDLNRDIYNKVIVKFPQASSIRDLMMTEAGRNWWKENGGDLHNAKFDLKEGSWSRYIMDEYLEERASKGKKWLTGWKKKQMPERQDNQEITPEQEVAIERVWQKIEELESGNVEEKTLSALSETTGGALVPPPEQEEEEEETSWLGFKIIKPPRMKSLEFEIKAAGQPCKQGESASRTGCIPKSKKPATAKQPTPAPTNKPAPKKKPAPAQPDKENEKKEDPKNKVDEKEKLKKEKEEAKAKEKADKEKAKKEAAETKQKEREKIKQEKEEAKKAEQEKKRKEKDEIVVKVKDEALNAAKAMVTDPNSATPDKVKLVGQLLLSLKLDDLKALASQLGAKKGTTKTSIIEAIKATAAKAVGVTTDVKPPTVTSSESTAAEDYKKNGTRSKSFKSWFGDWQKYPSQASKVVKPSGEPQETSPIPEAEGNDQKPIPVYHGTPFNSFNEFDKTKLGDGDKLLFGPGFYFTEDKKVAEDYRKRGSGYVDLPIAKLKASPEETLKKLKSMMQEYKAKAKDQHQKDWADSLLSTINKKNIEDELKKFGGSIKDRLGDAKINELVEIPEGHLFEVYLNIRKPFDGYDGKLDSSSLPKGYSDPLAQQLGVFTFGGKDTSGQDANAMTPDDWKKVFKIVTKHVPGFKPGGWQNFSKGVGILESLKTYMQEKPQLKEDLETAGMGMRWPLPDQVSYKDLAEIVGGKTKANAVLAGMGYDGISHLGSNMARPGTPLAGGGKHRVWIAFEPNQVKSANNEGTFDPSSANIGKGL